MTALGRVVLLVAVVLLAACSGDSDDGPPLPEGSEPIELRSEDFVAQIDNAYWPMRPGMRWVYRETDVDGSTQRVEVTVTDRKKRIQGIDATVVHDVVTEDGELVEDTYDWYAQDEDGNVWYLGEDTKEFENGKVTSTAARGRPASTARWRA
jgi:major membrane immunogen (membrane-anchored lipoprotein)